MSADKLPTEHSASEIAEFLAKVATTPVKRPGGKRGRLIFSLDATASREPTWDRACHIQSEMFAQTASLGGLDVQLCYYRGFGEFHASPWVSKPELLLEQMNRTGCVGGFTQIEKLLKHAEKEAKRQPINALVFIGDAMEESVDRLCECAGRLGLMNLPVFMFQEGDDPVAARAFLQIAQLSNGAYCSFDASSAEVLKELLSAVAVYAAGGREALEDFTSRHGGAALRLIHQLR
jgi:hypothetical protein